ncbi:MAG: flagellar protein FliS [Lachnospiraceae bacterium]|nr:flagellar protein FliS [Lachnospiraceae bacterium]
MVKELKQEYTRRITQANKTQLIVILYEMFLTYTKDAREVCAESRIEFRENIRKARGCLDELMASLDFEYEISMNLLQLYLYANRELIHADIRNNPKRLDEADKVIRGLHEAYVQLAALDTSAPVMENTQTIYAGLTYGKNTLTENLSDQGINRGFRV